MDAHLKVSAASKASNTSHKCCCGQHQGLSVSDVIVHCSKVGHTFSAGAPMRAPTPSSSATKLLPGKQALSGWHHTVSLFRAELTYATGTQAVLGQIMETHVMCDKALKHELSSSVVQKSSTGKMQQCGKVQHSCPISRLTAADAQPMPVDLL
jgi:hypothetical protein